MRLGLPPGRAAVGPAGGCGEGRGSGGWGLRGHAGKKRRHSGEGCSLPKPDDAPAAVLPAWTRPHPGLAALLLLCPARRSEDAGQPAIAHSYNTQKSCPGAAPALPAAPRLASTRPRAPPQLPPPRARSPRRRARSPPLPPPPHRLPPPQPPEGGCLRPLLRIYDASTAVPILFLASTFTGGCHRSTPSRPSAGAGAALV